MDYFWHENSYNWRKNIFEFSSQKSPSNKKNGSVIFDPKNSNETFFGDFKKATLHKLLKNWNNTIMRICARKLGHDKKIVKAAAAKMWLFMPPFLDGYQLSVSIFMGLHLTWKPKNPLTLLPFGILKTFFITELFWLFLKRHQKQIENWIFYYSWD